jgi:hypothetical protein
MGKFTPRPSTCGEQLVFSDNSAVRATRASGSLTDSFVPVTVYRKVVSVRLGGQFQHSLHINRDAQQKRPPLFPPYGGRKNHDLEEGANAFQQDPGAEDRREFRRTRY